VSGATDPVARARFASHVSRSSIIAEVSALRDQGVKEVTLLGQNVNSWRLDEPDDSRSVPIPLSRSFRLPGVVTPTATRRFPDLLRAVAAVDPEMRVRFTSPHPAHFPDDLLQLMAETPNICSALHLPLQSGSTEMLDRMRRRYSADAYRKLTERARSTIPGVSISTDIIVGFCGESAAHHRETLRMVEDVRYDQAFCFAYSMRDKTEAARTMVDDVPHATKMSRLRELIDLVHRVAGEKNASELGREHLVLVESASGRSPPEWGPGVGAKTGRTDGNKRVVFRDVPIPTRGGGMRRAGAGDYVAVRVTGSTSVTLLCDPTERTTLSQYVSSSGRK
jgi:MiaB/RimO family radical SAM methylthiotransferase